MTDPSAQQNEDRCRVRRGALLATLPYVAVLGLAALATVSREAATWLGLRGPSCPLGAVLGEDSCPGCGLTRSTAMVVQGHWHDAFALNPAGYVVVALSGAAILLHLDVWRRARVANGHLVLRSLGRWLFLVGILSAWAIRASRGMVSP